MTRLIADNARVSKCALILAAHTPILYNYSFWLTGYNGSGLTSRQSPRAQKSNPSSYLPLVVLVLVARSDLNARV